MVDYQEQALACNRRYLDALAVVDDPAPAYQQLHQVTEPKAIEGRSYAGFNPARRQDVRLFVTVLEGDRVARSFRDADAQEPLSFAIPSKVSSNDVPVLRWGASSNVCMFANW